MDKRTAIRECKKLWKEIEESGLSKDDFFDDPINVAWEEKQWMNYCPLCELHQDFPKRCPQCPLVKQIGMQCLTLGFYEDEICEPRWFEHIRKLKT